MLIFIFVVKLNNYYAQNKGIIRNNKDRFFLFQLLEKK